MDITIVDENVQSMQTYAISSQAQLSVVVQAFQREDGYRLSSWNTKADGSGISYALDGSFVPTDDFDLFAQWREPPTPYPIDPADGELISLGNGEYVAKFTTDSKVIEYQLLDTVKAVSYLVVGGGGAGGVYSTCGGGGAGGVVSGEVIVEPNEVISLSVGAGGAAKQDSGSAQRKSNNGKGSFLSFVKKGLELHAQGGGGGGTPYNTLRPGLPGGSGGGASSTNGSSTNGGDSTQFSTYGYGIGNPGGNTSSPSSSAYRGGAGGGGAGSIGSSPTGYNGAAGGAGIESDITGEVVQYAGGGGGGGNGSNGSAVGGAGQAGGGNGGGKGHTNGYDAIANSGSGGGGSSGAGTRKSGAGGSGIVILRFII